MSWRLCVITAAISYIASKTSGLVTVMRIISAVEAFLRAVEGAVHGTAVRRLNYNGYICCVFDHLFIRAKRLPVIFVWNSKSLHLFSLFMVG